MLPAPERVFTRIAGLLAAVAAPGVVSAQDGATPPERQIVVSAPGGGIDLDEAITLGPDEVWRGGSPELLHALGREAGISLQDAQNNPWQPNLLYRGFAASPLQGQAQGLAVYLDGVRFNQPFGDTVSFDLVPDGALRSVSLLDASPVYGLNALGGALVLESATGRTDPGFEASIALGSYGEQEAAISGGGASGEFSYFVAGQYRKERGWRDHSPSELGNLYADVGWDGAGGGIHAKFIGADTDLTGNGVAPVELLAARRRSVFTWPDNTQNRYGRISLHPWVSLGTDTRLDAVVYRQRLRVESVNGDAADIAACEELEGFLCLEAIDEDDDRDHVPHDRAHRHHHGGDLRRLERARDRSRRRQRRRRGERRHPQGRLLRRHRPLLQGRLRERGDRELRQLEEPSRRGVQDDVGELLEDGEVAGQDVQVITSARRL